MDAERDREIIRLWNELRRLQRDGRPTAVLVRRIEKALAARERVPSAQKRSSARRPAP
jgi:hypothetical protein